MYPRSKTGLRFEYRTRESQRVNDSLNLADQFPQLKSLAVDIGHFSPKGVTRNSQIKFVPNLDHAKSVFRIDCPNQGCIGGDFDLTESLAHAIAGHRSTVSAELCCQGWLSKTTVDSVHCHNILRYTFKLGY
jgi:hypothetical protein